MDPDTANADQLTVSIRLWAGGTVLRPEGELDHDSAAPLAEALEAALPTPPGQVVTDCSGLGFCDSTALNLRQNRRPWWSSHGERCADAARSPEARG
ncbi:STAS domain-containing protein [Kitasatospora sp. GP82]|uniref:STAS domain-containing protein n=1 Tax=Kitasatospora sp. GP82 TaxID=3035089 RepID=UPI0024754C9E|nr:STAS domain-containing protein [Kitasatospora sp. GP82]MDH6127352.1 anti-anti-sigma factor [Kitasatospora sp. GP82]